MTDASLNINNILKTIQLGLSTYLCEEEEAVLERLETIKVTLRPFSTVVFLRVMTSKGVKKMVMKTTTHHPDNKAVTDRENQAQVEYNILKYLHPRFEKVDQCSVPRPILVCPAIETYVMEFIEGKLLTDINCYSRYFSSQTGFNLLKSGYNLCGKWLRSFHQFTGVKAVDSEILAGVLEHCDRRLEFIEKKKDIRCPKDLRSRVMKLLQDQLNQLSGQKILVSGRQGDFGPWNVIVGPEGINVIDFLGYQEYPVPIDLLTTLVFLENERFCISGSPNRIKVLINKFLEGYGEVPDIPLPALIICEAMIRIESIFVIICGKRRHLHHRFEANLRLMSHISWLNDAGKRRLLWPSL